MFASCNPENPEERFQLYTQIIDFFKDLCSANPPVKQVGEGRAGPPPAPSGSRGA